MSHKNISVGMFLLPFSIHWYDKFSSMGKLARAFVSNLWAVCPISTKQAFHSLKRPGKSFVSQIGVVLRKNGIFYFMWFHKNCVHVARFDIPGAIRLHLYNPSVQDKHERVYCGISYQANFVWLDLDLEKTFYRLFVVLYYHSSLNDHFVFVVLICYWFCAALLIFTNA